MGGFHQPELRPIDTSTKKLVNPFLPLGSPFSSLQFKPFKMMTGFFRPILSHKGVPPCCFLKSVNAEVNKLGICNSGSTFSWYRTKLCRKPPSLIRSHGQVLSSGRGPKLLSAQRGGLMAWNWSWNVCLFYRWERQCFTVFRDGSKVVRSKSCLALLLVIIWAFLSCILYSEWGRGEEALINTSLQVDCAVPCLHFCIVKVQHQSHACNTPDTPTSSHDFWRQNKVNCLHELIKDGLDFHIKFFPSLVGHFNPALGTFAHYRKHHFLWNAKKFLAFGHWAACSI